MLNSDISDYIYATIEVTAYTQGYDQLQLAGVFRHSSINMESYDIIAFFKSNSKLYFN